MAKKVKKQMSVEEFDKLTLGGFHTLPYGVIENPNSIRTYLDFNNLPTDEEFHKQTNNKFNKILTKEEENEAIEIITKWLRVTATTPKA